MGIDSLLTGLSNWGWAFVFNKTSRGVGAVAEGHRQRAAALTQQGLSFNPAGPLPSSAGLTALTAKPMMKVWALFAGASLSSLNLFGLHAHCLPRVLFRYQRRYVPGRPAGRRSSA